MADRPHGAPGIMDGAPPVLLGNRRGSDDGEATSEGPQLFDLELKKVSWYLLGV